MYDADGNRVKSVMHGQTVTTIGNLYEKKVVGGATTHTKYYYFNGQRVAMRVAGVLYWLLRDHLGSTTVTADGATGGRTGELWYKPWGESRYTFGATPTQRRFTGQVLDEVAGGLYFYNPRYYDPALGRFAQADTIVPNPGNPQSLNRHSYALGNPLRFSDPSGHYECEGAINCNGPDPALPSAPPSVSPSRGGGSNRGGLYRDFWRSLADLFYPAGSPGSMISVSGIAGGGQHFVYGAVNVVTGNSGELQVFMTVRDHWFYKYYSGFLKHLPVTGPWSWVRDEDMASFGTAQSWLAWHTLAQAPVVTPQAGMGISGGRIYGAGFEKNGTSAFAGPFLQPQSSVSLWKVLGVGGDGYVSFDLKENHPSLSVAGWDAGPSVGVGYPPQISGGLLAVYSIPTPIYAKQLPGPLLLACRVVGLCGR